MFTYLFAYIYAYLHIYPHTCIYIMQLRHKGYIEKYRQKFFTILLKVFYIYSVPRKIQPRISSFLVSVWGLLFFFLGLPYLQTALTCFFLLHPDHCFLENAAVQVSDRTCFCPHSKWFLCTRHVTLWFLYCCHSI